MPDYVDRYHRDGFVHIPDLLPAAEMPALVAAVDEAVAKRKTFDSRPLAEKNAYEQ
jgi:hypothetical protein